MTRVRNQVEVPMGVLRYAIRSSRDAIVVLDGEGHVVEANPAAEALYGVGPGGLEGRKLEECRPGWDGNRVIVRDDGSEVAIECVAEGEAAPGWRVRILRDRSMRDRLVQERELALERYRALADEANDLIFTMDMEGTLLQMNGAAERILGYPVHEVEGQSVERFLGPSTLSEFTTAEERSQRPVGETRLRVVDFVRRDGRRIWLEAQTRVIATPGGKLIHGVARDVSERLVAEQQLRESEARFRGLIEALPCGAWIFDGADIVFANRKLEDLTGYPREQLLERDFFRQVVHPDDLAPMLEQSGARLSGERAEPGYSIRIVRPNGEIRVLDLYAASVTHEGRPAALIAAFDVTEQRRAERERRELETRVQQAQKLESLGVLAGGVAHDFNNLLVGVLGNAELVLMSSPTPEIRESIESIRLAAQRASELTRQLLAYSGKGKFVTELVDVSEMVREMAGLLSLSVTPPARLDLDVTTVPPVEADPAQLRQVAMNLLINASDALAGRPGYVRVRTAVVDIGGRRRAQGGEGELAPGRYVLLEVRDSGEGMNAATRARIFEPFFTTKFRGRGLGLAAVLGIVRSHGGAIDVSSRPGRGSTFRVLLPAAAGTVAEPRADAGEPAVGSAGRVLVADDDRMVRMVVMRMLGANGFETELAESGDAALARFAGDPDAFDLLIVDLTMPGMDGLALARRVRELRGDLPLLLMSGYPEHATESGLLEGAVFVQKPFSRDELLNAVARAMGR